MAFVTLGEALEAALASRLNEVGEEAIAVASDAVKSSKRGPDAETPGQFQGEEVSREAEGSPVKGHHSASRAHMDAALPMGRKRCIAPSSPSPVVASPKPAVHLFLVIDNGDRPERREEQLSGRSIARLPGGASRSKHVKLVHSASSS